MGKVSKSPVRRYNLDVYAPNWAADLHEETWYTREITKVISSGVSLDAAVLEVGVGTGVPFASAMLQNGFNVIGLDLSADLAKMSSAIVSQDGRSVMAVEGDSEHLPFANDSFDLVYSISSSWYFQDLGAAIREMSRVTAPGGTVAFDILNALHSSTAVNYFAAKIARLTRLAMAKLRNSPDPPVVNWSIRAPWSVNRLVLEAGLSPQVKGYLVLLPVSLPRLGERVNMAGRIPVFARGMKSVPLVNLLGAKLLYLCKKDG
jgi:SAM-dependent methyltransferase